jgi:SAM-dependent methyltransferase
MSVIWHDIECGAYSADLELWRSLAQERGDPVLDVGAGTGRVTLDLGRRGHRVTALDRDPALINELRRRAEGLPVTGVAADARDFELDERFALVIVPMQTIQLLGGSDGRTRFLKRAHRHMAAGGRLAVAITDTLELYDAADGLPIPLPDIRERDGVVYSSQPTAVREEDDGFVLERLRETVTADGHRLAEHDVIRLDGLGADQLEREALAAGLAAAGRRAIPATQDHVGSLVVMFDG